MNTKLITGTLLAAALLAVPAPVQAINAPPHVSFKAPTQQFHGRVTAVDAAAHTITVGTRVIKVAAIIPIDKNGQPATLKDVRAGQFINLAFKTDTKGRMYALVIHVRGNIRNLGRATTQ